MMRHAFAEGWLLLRQRAGVSVVLALALAVPISFAGVGMTLLIWLEPAAQLSENETTVAVLLHPQFDAEQRRQWISAQMAAHPEWSMSEVSSSDLVERLRMWFPYLEELVDNGDATLPPLLEIVTADPDSVSVLEDRSEVLAIGPRSSVQQLLGSLATRLAWSIAILSGVLLAAAILLAAVWVHLELFRHADELTIMRLVGATESTIRGPFLVAVAVPGMVAGLVSVVGSLATVAGLSRITSALGLPGVSLSNTALVLQVLAAVLCPVIAGLITLARHANDELGG